MVFAKNKAGLILASALLVAGALLSSCNKTPGYGRRTAAKPGKASPTTGAEYSFDANDSSNFVVTRLAKQEIGPNLKFIQGGRAVLGSQEQDVMAFRDNAERTVTIASFFMDETEVTNSEYRLFVNYVRDSIARTLLAEAAGDVTGGA